MSEMNVSNIFNPIWHVISIKILKQLDVFYFILNLQSGVCFSLIAPLTLDHRVSHASPHVATGTCVGQ